MNRTIAIVATIAGAAFILGLIVLDSRNMERLVLEERVEMLEEMMREKSRPVIYIERGTVYNSDGEVVIEDRHKDTKAQRK